MPWAQGYRIGFCVGQCDGDFMIPGREGRELGLDPTPPIHVPVTAPLSGTGPVPSSTWKVMPLGQDSSNITWIGQSL